MPGNAQTAAGRRFRRYKKLELVILVLFMIGLVVFSRNLGTYVTSEKIEIKKQTVVLDAGHGYTDSGKVGINDALEKDINLKVAKKVQKLLENESIEVVMTRKEDESLAPEGSTSIKTEDMKARVAMINETMPDLAVSIHQNSYQDPAIHGAQVFYYTHSVEGEKMAKILQEALLASDEDNTRQAKANDTYYLLRRTKVPTVIVECGFLSNPDEAEKLVTEEYQELLAEAIANGIETCLGE